jgi:anti-sigma factor RsiW
MTQGGKEDSMSHVDEGTLHAYLDGELASTERAALEAHLAQCATCRATLAEERALLERASALLGSARPAERPAPPFEQLRRAPKRAPWHVRRSLAWAASIALALGLGYYLRNPAARVAPATPVPQVAVAHDRGASPAPVRQVERQGRRAAADEAAQTREKVDSGATSVALGNEPQVHERPPSANAAPRPADALSTAAARSVTGALARTERDRGAAAASSMRIDGAPVPQLGATNWPVINRRVARSILGEEPVGLPGLATRSIRRGPGTDGTVVVEQAVDSSTVIQIFQRPASPALHDSAYGYTRTLERARSDRLLARFVGRLRVEIAGPVSPDSLNRLLEQVAPLP